MTATADTPPANGNPPAAPPGAGEFDLIARHFRPLAAREAGALSLLDDAALLELPPGASLVAAADAMVAGIHFLPDDPPALVARKLLRVNLSDMAAMGAEPRFYLLTVSLPADTPERWVADFAAGLAADQAAFGVTLVGGDTTRTTGPIALSLTILGQQERGRALLRAGARAGDEIWVSGTIGDGALGLLALTGGLDALPAEARGALVQRYHLPEPRVALGRRLVGIATACQDVSDGLVADLGHICRASRLAAEIEAEAVPLSPAAEAALAADPSLLARILTGGDDYELLFAAAPTAGESLRAIGAALGLRLTPIGRMVGALAPDAASPVRVRRADGSVLVLERGGWAHF
ncbi:MAG: thiamine-phosphate kinase [Alphaproteobacteria bacterium]|nr:thiamine-phosphate kinase [Alphaproteobacteria bacterium]